MQRPYVWFRQCPIRYHNCIIVPKYVSLLHYLLTGEINESLENLGEGIDDEAPQRLKFPNPNPTTTSPNIFANGTKHSGDD